MSVKISFTGVKEIDTCLKGMPLLLTDRVLAQAHTDAAFPLVSKAHFLAPVGKTGNLADSIGIVKVGIKRGGEVGQIAVGPRRGGGFKGFHGHFIEYGKTNRDGTKSQAKPFMGPAYDSTKNEVESGIANAIGKRLTAFMQKTLRHA